MLTLSQHRHVRECSSNTSNKSAHTSANLDHHWEADIDDPKDDKDDITAFRKFLVATLSIVYHDFRQLNIIPLFLSVNYCSNFGDVKVVFSLGASINNVRFWKSSCL